MALKLVASENGDIACGRFYFLGLQNHLLFSVYANHTRTPSQTHLLYGISCSFQLAYSYPFLLWSTSIGGPIDNEEVAANLRQMVSRAYTHFYDFSPQHFVEQTKKLFLDRGKAYFELAFGAAVLAFLGQFDNPGDLLRIAKSVALGYKTDSSDLELAASSVSQLGLANRALTALDNGPNAFRSFLSEQEAKCLPRFCPRRPKALSRLQSKKPFLPGWISSQERLFSEQSDRDVSSWSRRPLPMDVVATLTLVAKENGDVACGRNYMLGLKDHLVFGIYADRTSDPLETNLTFCITPTFNLMLNEPYWLWAKRDGWPVGNDDVAATLREMLRDPLDHFREFSAEKYVKEQRSYFLETAQASFDNMFNAAVLAFIGRFDDPKELLLIAKAVAETASSDISSRFVVSEVPAWLTLADRALAALDEGPDAFGSFPRARQAECLPRFCPKNPKAMLRLQSKSFLPG